MGKPYNVKISDVTDIELLEKWYNACEELATTTLEKLQPLRSQLNSLYYEVNELSSEYKKANNKAHIIKEKLDALKALSGFTFRVWYEMERRWGDSVFFYPLQRTSSGRVKGYQVVYRPSQNIWIHTQDKTVPQVKTIGAVGPIYEVLEITYSAAVMQRLNKLKHVVYEGRNIEGELDLIIRQLKKKDGYGSSWTIHEGQPCLAQIKRL